MADLVQHPTAQALVARVKNLRSWRVKKAAAAAAVAAEARAAATANPRKVALAATATAAESDIHVEDLKPVLEGLSKLPADGTLAWKKRKLSFNFTQVNVMSGNDLDELIQSLPRFLENLDISFEGCKELTTIAGLGALAGLPLVKLSMHFPNCGQLSRVDGMLALWPMKSLPALEELFLDFRNCSRLTHVDGLQSLVGLREMKSLHLDFRGCYLS